MTTKTPIVIRPKDCMPLITYVITLKNKTNKDYD